MELPFFPFAFEHILLSLFLVVVEPHVYENATFSQRKMRENSLFSLAERFSRVSVSCRMGFGASCEVNFPRDYLIKPFKLVNQNKMKKLVNHKKFREAD